MKKCLVLLLVAVFAFQWVPPVSASATGSRSVPGFLDQFLHEEVTGVLTARRMEVIVFPLRSDFFHQYFSDGKRTLPTEVRTYVVSDVEIGYKNLYLAPDHGVVGGFVRYTVFYHTTGSRLVAIGVYDRGAVDKGGRYVAQEQYFSSDFRTGRLSPDTEHSVLGDYYPNKIINDLEVAEAVLDYQAVNGPFVAGREYSMLEIMNFHGRSGYVPGKTSSGSIVTGGGACVMATNWMKILTLSGADIIEHWQHYTGSKYFESPMGADVLSVSETDATVEWPSYDLRWVQKKTSWVKVTAMVMPDGDVLANPLGEEDMKYDAIELITFRFTTEKPDLSSAKIDALQKAYVTYRSDSGSGLELSKGSVIVKSSPWHQADEKSQLLTMILPEERVDRFEHELSTDPLLISLVLLRSTINSIPAGSDVLVGSYLRESEWYKRELSRLKYNDKSIAKLESALRHLDAYSNSWPGQKVQCVGLGILVYSIDSRFANIGGIDSDTAAGMVPSEIKSGARRSVGNFHVISSINDVRVGDMGFRYDTPAGHVFAVVDKKKVDGKTVLLIVSANQRGDGRVTIFEVDDSNFEAVFGIPAYFKVVIRGW